MGGHTQLLPTQNTVIMKNYISFVCVIFTLFQSCSKSDENNEASPFTVKYEIISSSKIISPGSSVIISYTNSTGQLQTKSFSSSDNLISWNETINVTSAIRPLTLNLSITSSGAANGGYLAIANSGTITQNIYINDILKSSNINNSTSTNNSWGYKIAPTPINHIVH